ncbi:polyprenyl diphosphate synthase [Candidatus Parcubacteria bacterium]|nr:di-trans,poly-cis-decaprenylcistransferase [Patescibacteria group bacterium]MBU4482180.1 di-trans,poly-cis-decaprenylcistransferase [Patescibacteria group bacterium]MCG2686798.1 polyprenyl diphosphate synthase [Candidatus Parcubacteria bacterium]
MNKLNHLAIIMDGNRRWARKKGLPAFEGHIHGYQTLKKVGDWCLENSIKFFTAYAFSTENWNRSKLEVNFLMNLFEKILKNDIDEFNKKGLKMKFIGQLKKYPKKLNQLIKHAEKLTKNNKKGTLIICLSYGGRSEIVDAVKKIIKSGINPEYLGEKINEKLIYQNLYSPDIPDPDLILRTGGEMRLSNFLTWQSVYSELYFSNTLWPDFSKKEFNKILKEYYNRQRRFGK